MTDLRQRIYCVGLGIAIGLLLAAFAAAGIAAWKTWWPSLPSVLAPTSPKVDDIKTETKDCKTVQAFKDPAKRKLDLPEHVQKDEQASVIAAAPIPPSDYPRTATAVLHRDTGIGEIYLHDDPMPWVSFSRRWTVGAFYGVRDDVTQPVMRFTGLYKLAQIKALHIGIQGQIDTDGRRFGGIGAWASGN